MDTIVDATAELGVSKRHFIFGYGSLICPRSRAITAPTLASRSAHPILVRHLKRSWSARVDCEPQQHSDALIQPLFQGHTAMGVRKTYPSSSESSTCWCSGVLIEVNDLELQQFDEREQGYDRIEIDLVDIWSLEEHEDKTEPAQHIVVQEAQRIRSVSPSSPQIPLPLSVWVYVQHVSMPANPQFPIFQSYVDVILRGCLFISTTFARRFLETTDLWWHDDVVDSRYQEMERHPSDHHDCKHHHYIWIEDRHDPYYIRADPHWSLTMASSLDTLLQEHHPLAFQKRIPLPAAHRILNAFEKMNEDEFD